MTKIESAHGAGGKIMQRLLEEVIIPSFGIRKIGTIGLDEMDDGATLIVEGKQFIVCTDAHTVYPIFFPGGDLGKLTACGTVNDCSVMGARPIALTNTLIVEEGTEITTIQTILKSLNDIIEPLGIAMVAGDTKVMPKGTLDGVIMTTTGIGEVYLEKPVTDTGVQPGDAIILSGPVGNHGTCLLAHREGLKFDTNLISDVAPLWEPIQASLDIGGVHAMKDPTRGGTAVALNELATKSKVEIEIRETDIPILKQVQSLCELLGLDPLHMSNEGMIVMAVDHKGSEEIINVLHSFDQTKHACVIGTAKRGTPRVVMETEIGGKKLLQVPYGEPVPRVC